MRNAVIVGFVLLLAAMGCKHKPTIDAAAADAVADQSQDTAVPSGEADPSGPARAGAAGAHTQVMSTADRIASIDPAGYVCDTHKTTSTCREINAASGSAQRRGEGTIRASCEQNRGTFASRAGGQHCDPGYIATCTSPSGNTITHYYADGPTPWTLESTQKNCLTLGNWSKP
jgi:hypothetical protein